MLKNCKAKKNTFLGSTRCTSPAKESGYCSVHEIEFANGCDNRHHEETRRSSHPNVRMDKNFEAADY